MRLFSQCRGGKRIALTKGLLEIESGFRCDSTECQHVCRGVAAKTVGAVSGKAIDLIVVHAARSCAVLRCHDGCRHRSGFLLQSLILTVTPDDEGQEYSSSCKPYSYKNTTRKRKELDF